MAIRKDVGDFRALLHLQLWWRYTLRNIGQSNTVIRRMGRISATYKIASNLQAHRQTPSHSERWSSPAINRWRCLAESGWILQIGVTSCGVEALADGDSVHSHGRSNAMFRIAIERNARGWQLADGGLPRTMGPYSGGEKLHDRSIRMDMSACQAD